MMRKFNIATLTVFFGSIIINAGQARAIVYNFNDFNPGGGSISANGFLEVNDTSNIGIVDFPTELVDWEITLTDGTDSETLNSSNSSLSSGVSGIDPLPYLQGVTVSPTLLDFTTANALLSGFKIESNTTILDNEILFTNDIASSTETLIFNGVNSGATVLGGSLSLEATAAVPFEFSPSLGILAVGVFWGVYNFRNRK